MGHVILWVLLLCVIGTFIFIIGLAIYSVGLQRKATKGSLPRALEVAEHSRMLGERSVELQEKGIAQQEESLALQREAINLLRDLNSKLDRGQNVSPGAPPQRAEWAIGP